MKRCLTLLAAFLLFIARAGAQETADDPRMMIFRGKVVVPYTFLYNGNF